MVTEEQISEAVSSLLRESNPSQRSFTTLNQVVEELQAKLGHDLSHKLDFITAQINLLFGSQPQPPQPPPQNAHRQIQQPKDHFAPPPNPNFHSVPVSSGFQAPKFPNSNAVVATAADISRAVAPAPVPAPAPVNDAPKESTQTKAKRRGGPGGLTKLCGVSPELQVIVGQPALSRTEIVKQLWAYIRKNNLQDPSNKRKIICNEELRVVFETDCTDMFKMNKLLAKHIIPLEPTKKPVPKKQKVDVDSGKRIAEPTPSVVISDALANFFGVTEREMLQSEVLRRIWEYIKVNQLEDPMNPMAILCDAKLQEIFGCESISALGIPEVLGGHHIFRSS
ncbi:hypothetical protein PHAVU_006G049900 [Phaseolus vulgaris]|uniref:DM2 domain-containing protein n=1 Tax=Phaseolus vulgaris TaxID=3885 RepID=V7BKP8_PHAVU|nr:hypothetical protein PHAVU_006G049900g [Phaseolus vulgaris]ESW18542.1 hypothetical protein PHAVU_006G049900g [Phaseolus vulgaris]